jgi:hypothetical protein
MLAPEWRDDRITLVKDHEFPGPGAHNIIDLTPVREVGIYRDQK